MTNSKLRTLLLISIISLLPILARGQSDAGLNDLVQMLTSTEDPQLQLDILRGLSEAFKGKRDLTMPPGWAKLENKLSTNPNEQVRLLAQSLSLTFGSKEALDQLKKVVLDSSADANTRRAALDSLLTTRDPNLPKLLQSLLKEPGLRGQAIRGLARFDDSLTASSVLGIYSQLNGAEKRDALNTLTSRASYAKPLLAAVYGNEVPKKDLTAEIVRQLRNLKSPDIDAGVQKVWGAFREASADKKKEIERYTKLYWAGGSTPGDAVRGRAVFARTCQQCHTLFEVGGNVGPDITGSNRTDLQYLLENILDPNAVIPNDYRSSTITMKDDRVITGIIKKDEANSLTVAAPNETLVLPKSDIESVRVSEISMMPEGLLAALNDQEVRDLLYYLSRPGQVPFLATPDTVAYFFTGKDLAGWEGNTDLWKIENGEIVGSSKTGLDHNEFLKGQMVFGDFRLICKIKLTPNKENSSIQFRSEALPDGEVKGYQADAGAGWWGKLYEEQGRGVLWDKSGEQYLKADDWNTYEIVAVGHRIRTALNGKTCVDLEDAKGATQGIFALQLHAGGPLEVRFKELHIEVNPVFELKTAL
jgi:putative heme-binding domain-containing protein